MINKEIEELKVKASDLQDTMKQLKTELYAKFGNNINLEAEED